MSVNFENVVQIRDNLTKQKVPKRQISTFYQRNFIFDEQLIFFVIQAAIPAENSLQIQKSKPTKNFQKTVIREN